LVAVGERVHKYYSGVQQHCETRESILKSMRFSVEELCLDKQNEESEKLDSLITFIHCLNIIYQV